MLETILGGLFGGVLRIAPEIMKFMDRSNERKHELAMQDKALEFETLRGAAKSQELSSMQDIAHLDALQTAYSSQTNTGVRWVDALSASVRPAITYMFCTTALIVKYIYVFEAMKSGSDLGGILSIVWTEHDASILNFILSFWFVGRVFDKNR